MDNYKIKVKDEARANEARDLFKALGYHPDNSSYEPYVEWVAVFEDRSGSFYSLNMDLDECEELTFPQLRDLVTQSKSNVREYLDPNDNYKLCLINPSDAAHWMIEVPEGADCLMHWRSGEKVFYRDNHSERWNCTYRGWYTVMGDDGFKQMGTLWERPTQDPALISGAEAKLAWANGESVQFRDEFDKWYEDWTDLNSKKNGFWITDFDLPHHQFRIKPTLTVNAELPKPSREFQLNTEVYAVTYEFKTREERNSFADKLRGTNS
ncbi:TPA: hypothetical protein ACNH0E_000095 [Acinetobacter baumannii]